MHEQRLFKAKIVVRFKKRDDGGLRALCDEVPGFYLSGHDRRAVMADVIPAIELLMRANMDIAVHVSPLGRGLFQLTEKSSYPADLPDLPEYDQEYVVELAA